MNEIGQELNRLSTGIGSSLVRCQREPRAEVDVLILPGVEKIVLDNNQFGVKNRILREASESKLPLYQRGAATGGHPTGCWMSKWSTAASAVGSDRGSGFKMAVVGPGPDSPGWIGPHARSSSRPSRRETLKVALCGISTLCQVQLDAGRAPA